MMTTDTPRTHEEMWTTDYHHELCNVVNTEFAQQLERELSHSLANQLKTQAEVERLKELVNESISEKSNLSIALVNCQADLHRAVDVARMLPVIPIPAISSRDITDTLYAELNQLKANHDRGSDSVFDREREDHCSGGADSSNLKQMKQELEFYVRNPELFIMLMAYAYAIYIAIK